MTLILFFALALGIPVIDQITKLIVDANMTLGQSIPIWKDVFHITYIHNEGTSVLCLCLNIHQKHFMYECCKTYWLLLLYSVQQIISSNL